MVEKQISLLMIFLWSNKENLLKNSRFIRDGTISEISDIRDK